MSVTEHVQDWVEKRPYVQDALAEEIVNYSALARKVQDEVDGGFEAVKMALRRHAEDLKKVRKERHRNIGKVVDGTSVELRSNFKVCKSPERQEGEIVAKTEGGYTAIKGESTDCSGDVIDDQVLVTLKSPESLEDTPGVLSYILSVLAARGINLTEVISCREDTHLVVHEDDATDAFRLLNEKLKG